MAKVIGIDLATQLVITVRGANRSLFLIRRTEHAPSVVGFSKTGERLIVR